MKTQKIITILLIAAIIFSVASLIFNVYSARSLNPSRFYSGNNLNAGTKSSGQVGFEVLPQGEITE